MAEERGILFITDYEMDAEHLKIRHRTSDRNQGGRPPDGRSMPGPVGVRRGQPYVRRRIHTFLMLVGLVSILMLPVDYRGGAAISHPYAISRN